MYHSKSVIIAFYRIAKLLPRRKRQRSDDKGDSNAKLERSRAHGLCTVGKGPSRKFDEVG